MNENENCCVTDNSDVKIVNIAYYLKNKGWKINLPDDENDNFVDFSYKHDEEQYHICLPVEEREEEKESIIQNIADIENRSKEQVKMDIINSKKRTCKCCCGE